MTLTEILTSCNNRQIYIQLKNGFFVKISKQNLKKTLQTMIKWKIDLNTIRTDTRNTDKYIFINFK